MRNSLKKRLFAHLYSNLIISCTFALVQKKNLFTVLVCCFCKFYTVKSQKCVYLKGIRVFSPQKVSRFAPLNRYYIIKDEVFFGNYLFISCMQKNNTFILVYFCQRSQMKLFLLNLQKQHTRTVKRFFFFVPTQKCMK
jgi:hypothetical protein